MSTDAGELTQDVVFDILSSARRRYVLYLLRTEGEMELTELAEHVAAWENDTTIEELTKQQRKRVYVSLYQTHVPKLADAGLVDYDQDSGEVALAASAPNIDRYLATDDEQFPWQYIYLPLAVVGLAVVALSSLDVWVFASLSQLELAIVLVVGFLVTAAAHATIYLAERREVPEELERSN
jgi:DNA-binding transcriptional ArsR family regulator